ncbi:MAG: hypothetical protein AAGA67_12140 [Cyanobacteria bacterium P01_F01_bin.153]
MGILQKLFGLGNGASYFLDDDDAKTFGDIDYMRKEITVERTYPKGKADDVPVDKYVPPALDKGKKKRNAPYQPQVQSYTPPAPTSSFAPQSFAPQTQSFAPQTPAPQPPAPQAPAEQPAAQAPVEQPAAQTPEPAAQEEAPKPTFTPPEPKKPSGDDGMDMFRSMAKNIRR